MTWIDNKSIDQISKSCANLWRPDKIWGGDNTYPCSIIIHVLNIYSFTQHMSATDYNFNLSLHCVEVSVTHHSFISIIKFKLNDFESCVVLFIFTTSLGALQFTHQWLSNIRNMWTKDTSNVRPIIINIKILINKIQ